MKAHRVLMKAHQERINQITPLRRRLVASSLTAMSPFQPVAEGTPLTLFDVPLHYSFLRAAQNGQNFDMRSLFTDTLVEARPECAVTFIDNHDTEPGQALESYIPEWFKPIAYSMILLRESGIPCVFYGDYYGVESANEDRLLRRPFHRRLYKEWRRGAPRFRACRSRHRRGGRHEIHEAWPRIRRKKPTGRPRTA